ncbi:hypothetical protein [Azospirillum sp. sgz302134]
MPVGDGFARRVDALDPAAEAASEAAFVLESRVEPGAGPVADIDACVLADPAAFLEPLSAERPLALQYFPGNLARLYDGVGGGLLVLLPEPSVRALFDRVRRFLVSWTAARRLHYFLDQIALTAGTDDAIRRGACPGIHAIPTEGRLFLCGDGVFVRILTEKNEPGFADAVRALLDRLERTPPSTDPRPERERFLKAIGVDQP